MRFLFRLIPALVGLVILVMFGLIVWQPARLGFIFGGALLLIAYGLYELLGRRLRESDFWWSFGLAVFFLASGVGFFLYLESWIGQLMTALMIAALLFLFVEQLYRWFYSMKIPSYTLGVMVALVELCTVFFLASDFIGFRIFMRAPVWLLTLVFFVTTAMLYLIARSVRGGGRAHLLPAILIGLVFAELFWAVLFLPTSFLVGGAMIAIVWYTIAGLMRMVELGMNLRASAPRYVGLASFLLVVVALFARWM